VFLRNHPDEGYHICDPQEIQDFLEYNPIALDSDDTFSWKWDEI
jgi:hypothetical protein